MTQKEKMEKTVELFKEIEKVWGEGFRFNLGVHGLNIPLGLEDVPENFIIDTVDHPLLGPFHVIKERPDEIWGLTFFTKNRKKLEVIDE